MDAAELSSDPLYQRIRRAFLSDVHKIDAGFDPGRGWMHSHGPRKGHPHYQRHYDKWSTAEDEHLVALLRAGWCPSYIAAKLKRSRRGVWKRMARLRKKGIL